jgi:hypothetical protein
MAIPTGPGKRDLLKIAAIGGAVYAGGLIPSAFAAKSRKKNAEKESRGQSA